MNKSRIALIIEQALLESRHDDLLKQSFTMIKSYVSNNITDDNTLKSTNNVIGLYESIWQYMKEYMSAENFPPKWKYYLADITRQSLIKSVMKKGKIVDKKLEKKIKFKNLIQGGSSDSLDRMYRLAHYIEIDYEPIRNFDPNEHPEEAFSILEELESEWKDQKSSSTWIKSDGSEKKILEMGKYSWFLIDKEVCEEEGRVMGHCGNRTHYREGDKILSLRQEKTIDGTKFFRPSLTFIMNDGLLGEMRGKANTKPKKMYHPYIIELLKHDMIEGIDSERAIEPSKSFELNDLPSHVVERIFELKGEDFVR